ncbi:MAG TPA: diguanylate cyclase [Candidatus Limnocylindria bacterium]|nr:diguanylate cyclase [Candidatus Limnocylindria bacterium]
MEPGPGLLFDLALIAFGAALGALLFSVVVGRRRAHQLARLTDQLAQATHASPPHAPPNLPDRILNSSIERLARRIADVETLAATDQLTRLLNRPASVHALAAEIERANRYGRPLAVALIDVDHFKRVNDTHGHAVGDEVLRQVARLLRASIRGIDTLGRYGGEEFLLVMPETDVDGGRISAENLRRVVGRTAIAVPIEKGQVNVTVTLSAGVSGGDGSTLLDVDRVLGEADGALYGAKDFGRDNTQVFRPLDDGSRVPSATIGAGARAQASELGLAAFQASNLHLLGALAQRPGWAGGTSQLIADLAADLGRAVGLPDGDIDRIRTASLLHDVGKVAIPDEILSKPSALTSVEWRSIVEHPRIGQVVLEQAGAIRDAASIVLHHHEWFDGTGYPHGLAGEDIPIGSRIVAIADAYEAMISERPYKSARSHDEAVAELRRQRGIQFDPDLVNVFLSLVAGPHRGSRAIASRGITATAGRSVGPGLSRRL